MQKTAISPGKLLTMAVFVLSCFGLLLFLWVSFGGPVPLKARGYQIKVAVPEATQLGIEADVRLAGVTIGRVAKKGVDAQHPNATIATIEINHRNAPLPADTRAILRQKTLLGETYIELTPGTKGSPRIREGGWLRDSRVAPTVQLDEIFRALDPRTRAAFRVWQRELAVALHQNGGDLNQALAHLRELAENGSDVLRVFDDQAAMVRRLVRNTGVTFGALTQNEAQLRTLIASGSEVFDATSREADKLAETFRVFPTFLDESKSTFAKLDRFARNGRSLARDLKPVGRDLRPTVRDVRGLAPDLERVFARLDPLLRASRKGLPALRDVLRGAKPLLGELQPFLEQLNPVLQWLEYHQTTTSDFITNGTAGIVDTTSTTTDREIGHYLRQYGNTGVESGVLWANRPSFARGNAYPLPKDFATGPKHSRYMIFANWDCANTGKGGDGSFLTKLPDTDDDPSCWVQPAPPVPPGNTRQLPHIEKADYSAP